MSAPDPTVSSGGDLLVLIYGMACPLRCDFCCHPVEDHGSKPMGVEAASRWLVAAGEVPSIARVVFTGGEPFSYERDILAVLERRPERLPVRVVTAAHWAPSVEAAKLRLRPWIEHGLDELSVSTDPSHQQFVPAAYAENAARAALELGLTVEIASVFWEPNKTAHDCVDVPQGALVTGGLAVPVGRGRDRVVTPADYELESAPFAGCGDPVSVDVTVYPNGDVYPCCSGGKNIEAKLRFGNLHHDPLASVVERIHADRYTRLALGSGFSALYEVCRFKFPHLLIALPSPDDLVSACQLCAKIHADEELLGKLQPAIDYATAVFGTVETLVRETAA